MPQPDDTSRSEHPTSEPVAQSDEGDFTPAISFPSEVRDLLDRLGLESSEEEPPSPTGRESNTSTEPASTHDLPAIPGYQVTGEIARGGMGRVLFARDLTLERDVAIKVLLRGSSRSRQRFIRESIITARLPHPGVPPVHAMGRLSDGRPFLAMKLIQGRTLASLLKTRLDSSDELPRFVQVFEQVCQAVGFAHSQGIIHRDLKPLNIMVGAFGEVQVMDWGLAREIHTSFSEESSEESSSTDTGESTDLTREGSVMGTLSYMPPEQARGELVKLGTRSDVFSLGGILCAILTGRPPYTASTRQELLVSAIRSELQEAFSRLDACGADSELVKLCKQCLHPEIQHRPRDGKALADAVAGYRANQEARARQAEAERAAATARAEEAVQRVEAESRAKLAAEAQAEEAMRRAKAEEEARLSSEARAREQRKRRRIQLVLGGLVLFMLACGGGFAWWQDSQEDARRRDRLESIIRNERSETARVKAESEIALQKQSEELRKLRNREATITLLDDLENKLRASDALRAGEALVQVRKRIAEGGADDLQGRLDRSVFELSLLRELDQIDNDHWMIVDGKVTRTDAILARWARCFERLGIPGSLSSQQAAEKLQSAFIAERLFTSLEMWFEFSDGDPKLYAILSLADPDPFRNHVRQSGYARAALSLAFKGRPLPLAQPVWFAIGQGVSSRLDRQRQQQLLLRAHEALPNNFLLLMSLASLEDRNDRGTGDRRAGWYRAALAVHPGSIAAWHNLGATLFEMEDIPGAIAAYRAGIKLEGQHAPLHSNLGIALRSAGDLAASIDSCREAIRLDPRYAPARVNLGVALKDTNDLRGAIDSFQEAIRIDPWYARAHNNLGVALAESGRYPEAILAYKDAIRLNPRYAEAFFNLASTLKDSGNVKAAIDNYREAIRFNPRYPEAHNNLGVALYESGDLPRAIVSYREALRLNPRNAGALNNLGMALADSKDFPGAIACYRQAIRLNPSFALAYFNLGSTLSDTGDSTGAIASYREAIRLDPGNSLAHNNLGIALKEAGDLPGAIASYREAVRADRKNLLALFNLAVALAESGDSASAIACYRQLVQADPSDAQAYHNLGKLLRAAGNIPAARAALTEAARLDPKNYGHELLKLPPITQAPPPREVNRH